MSTKLPKNKAPKKTLHSLRVRMKPSERRDLILAGAIDYFAEFGFAGKTRELSDRLGITQPLLYRYFPSKKALMEEVLKSYFWTLGIKNGTTFLAIPIFLLISAYFSFINNTLKIVFQCVGSGCIYFLV